QYKFAGSYLDRREAIEFACLNQNDPKAVAFLKVAMKDKYDGLRGLAINRLDLEDDAVKKAVEPVLADIAKNDSKRLVKAAAMAKLGEYKKSAYASLFATATNDSSYTISGVALQALAEIDEKAAIQKAAELSKAPA